MTLRKSFPTYRFKPHSGTFGLEIETEVEEPDDYPSGFLESKIDDQTGKVIYVLKDLEPYWIGHEDNSLRNFGVEYVYKTPLTLAESIVALRLFEEKSRGIPFLKDAPGTSVHVHVNFLDEEVLTLANFLTTWVLFENILTVFSGPTRVSNLFALPTRVAEGVYQRISSFLTHMMTGDRYVLQMDESSYKYGAINLCPLGKFGSVEIRSFRGTTDVEEIIEWLSIIQKMLEFSRRSINPRDIVSMYRDEGLGMFFEVFGEHSDSLLSGIADPEFMIDRNLFYAGLGIAEAVPDWDAFDKMFKPKEPKPETQIPPVMTILDEVASTQPYLWQEAIEAAESLQETF